MRIRSAVCAVLVLVLSAFDLSAGDIATFINLGFSDSSAYFMFGYHGIDSDSGKPFAEIYTVDVKANKFVPGGIRKESYPDTLQPGQDAGGAFYTLLEKNGPVTQKFRINHLKQGRLLYILVNGDTAKENLEFRDFNTQNLYKVRLLQKSQGKEAAVKSAFHIDLAITLKDGRTKTYKIGLPDYYREKVMEYRIRQVVLSPDEQHLVFIVERDHYAPKGKSVRYMVETVKLF